MNKILDFNFDFFKKKLALVLYKISWVIENLLILSIIITDFFILSKNLFIFANKSYYIILILYPIYKKFRGQKYFFGLALLYLASKFFSIISFLLLKMGKKLISNI